LQSNHPKESFYAFTYFVLRDKHSQTFPPVHVDTTSRQDFRYPEVPSAKKAYNLGQHM